MAVEPFVIRGIERAQEWVEVCSKSCHFKAELSASILASLCGFGTWDVMVYAIADLPPSKCDEQIELPLLHLRHEAYASVLMINYRLPMPLAALIISRISPSSSKPFTVFDAPALVDIDDDDDSDDDQRAFDIDEHFAAISTAERLGALLPHSAEIDPIRWAHSFDYLGWRWEALEDKCVIGEPAFVLHFSDRAEGCIPVYLAHALPCPEFDKEISEFSDVRLAQHACLGNFVSEWSPKGSTDFILLASRPHYIVQRKRSYCCIGLAYSWSERAWTDLIINRNCQDLKAVIQLNRKATSFKSCASTLSEPDGAFCKQLALRLSGFDINSDDEEHWTTIFTESDLGWIMVGAVENGRYDFAEIYPHMLAEFELHAIEESAKRD
jgi:hypothetical protein